MDRFLHSDMEPFKLYFTCALYILKWVKKLKQCDIIVVQGYPAIVELFISVIISRLTRKLLIVKETHWYWPQTLKSKLLFPIYVRLLENVDGIFVPGVKSYRWWLKLGFKPSIVHYYWLEAELMPCKNYDKYAKLKRPYTLLYLGRLIPKRGVDLIIRAFHNFIRETDADATLIIAGEGPLRPNLEKIVKELHLDDKVCFLGLIPEHEKQCLYKIADLFIYAPIKTVIPEEWPIPPLEALKVGCPTIVSDVVGSIPDIREGLIIVKSGDVDALAKAMALYYKNLNLRRNLAQQGQKKALSITTEHVYKEFLRAILNIIKSIKTIRREP
ncbi:MAG: glycosyltransferase family 4 protein [Candidatus Bathyarchaeia archaeon]